MADSDKQFSASVPKFYDTPTVPLIFERYAADVAARVSALSPRLSADARYAVTDLNQLMLDYAALRQGDDARIEWRKADALRLPFDSASFDAAPAATAAAR